MSKDNNNKEYLGLPGEVNPHIPQYIADAPWYLGKNEESTKGPSLHHQKQAIRASDGVSLSQLYKTGIKRDAIGAPVRQTKYKKGSCENCGATTHSKSDCVERPRRKGARFNNSNIAPEEEVPVSVSLSWDAEQDRYAGWTQDDYTLILKDHELLEHERRQTQKEELVIDEEKETGVITSNDEKYRCTTRNLRIREDTAKYLLNLDTESAFYDPKTRSMRENPLVGLPDKGTFRGDNATLGTGEASRAADIESFAWKAYQATGDGNFHAFSNPTLVSLAMNEHSQKLKDHSSQKSNYIQEQYDPDMKLNVSITENKHIIGHQSLQQAVYDENAERVKPTVGNVNPAYVEDEYDLDHLSVWGSFYDIESNKWGYKCCQKIQRYDNCSGIDVN